MSGRTKLKIEAILEKFSHGDILVERLIETKLYVRGIRREVFKEDTKDDPAILMRLEQIERELEAVFFK